MKKFLAFVLAAVMVLALVGCTATPATSPAPSESAEATEAPSESTEAPTESAAPAEGENAPAEGEAFKVAIVLGVGGLGDESFNDSMYDGCQMAMSEDSSITVQVIEPTEVAEFEGHYMELAKTGEYDLIIGSGFDGVEAVTKVSGLFPEQQFMFVDGDCGDLPNVASFTFRDEEKAFLLGYMAAQMSETKKIGIVGGMDIPSINMFAAGYEAGAAYAGNGTTVERKYVGAWNDTSTGKELALALYDGGCDIVYQAAGGSGLGVFAAAKEKDLLAIGADTNQCLIDPDHIFVSGMRTLNYIIRDGIMAAKEGTLQPGSHSVGLKENGVTYTCEGSNVEVPEEIIANVEKAKEDIMAGTIVVPSTLEDVASFVETYCNK